MIGFNLDCCCKRPKETAHPVPVKSLECSRAPSSSNVGTEPALIKTRDACLSPQVKLASSRALLPSSGHIWEVHLLP